MDVALVGAGARAGLITPENRWERHKCVHISRSRRRWNAYCRGRGSTWGHTGGGFVSEEVRFVPAKAAWFDEVTRERVRLPAGCLVIILVYKF